MNVYLIVSESYKLLNEEIAKVIPSDARVVKYDMRSSSLDDVINEAGYYSLLPETKYIVVKNASFFKANKKEEGTENNDAKLLEKYLGNSSENSIIIYTSYEMPDKRKKIFKVINDNKKYIEIPSLNKKDLTYKCLDLLKNNGYKTTYEVASYIVDNSYTNYDILLNELEKIYTLVKSKELTLKDIEGIISLSVSNKTFAYVSAVLKGDLKTAINSISTFEKMKIDPIVVLITLAKEVQIYLNIKRGVFPKEIQRFYAKEDWMMKNYLLNSENFTEKELKKIITILNDYDYKLKSGNLEKSLALDLLALDLCS